MADLTYTELLSIMAAAFSDADTKKRLAEIQAALQLQNEAQAKAETLLAEANAMRATATRIAALAEAERQNLAGKQAELEKFELTLSDHNQALIAEKAAWEKIRGQVDGEQKEAAERLAKWELDLKRREDAVTSREVGAQARELAANTRMSEAEAKIAALRSALETIEPPRKRAAKNAA